MWYLMLELEAYSNMPSGRFSQDELATARGSLCPPKSQLF